MSLPNPFLTLNPTKTEIQNSTQHVPQRNQNFNGNLKNSFQKQPNKQWRGRGGHFINNRGNFQHPGGFTQKNSNFQDSRANNSNFCTYCNEGFATQIDFQAHRRSHQKCPYDECKFNANELAVSEHIQKVHIGTKIKDLTSPEDIEKWREERRKRYPTAANVQLRQQIQEMKQNRGEKLHDSKARFGDQKQKDFFAKCHEDRINYRKERKERIKQKKEELKKAKKKARRLVNKMVVEPITDKGKISFKGTKEMKDYHKEEESKIEKNSNNSLSLLNAYGSDSESENENQNAEKLNESSESIKSELDNSFESQKCQNDPEIKEINNEYDNLINSTFNDPEIYSKDDENDNELQEEITTSKNPPNDTLNDPNDTRKQSNDDDEAPEEVSNPKVDDQPILESNFNKRKHPSQPHNKITKKPRTVIDYSKLKNLKTSNPFLEKLLHREIVHERNYLLQCVNFVVKNNFFGVGQKCDKNEAGTSKDEEKS